MIAKSAPLGTKPTPSIEVALGTFNSERFLPELLDSLFAQTYQAFTLIVADDGSVDSTFEILARYMERYLGRIKIVGRGGARPLGPSGNFSRLLELATADYLLLCDHDDVWLPNKVALSLERMLEFEGRHGPDTPLLVHTDLVVVGPALEVLGPSFFRYSGVDPAQNHLTRLLTRNVVTGCASIMNRSLYERARPIPPEASMHDRWLALVAAALGSIEVIDQPTILYRQHGGNVIGAKARAPALMRRIRKTLFSRDGQRMIMRYSDQAATLLDRYGDQMPADLRRPTETLAHLWSFSRWRRFFRLRRSGVGFRGLMRNAALLIVVTRGGRRNRRAGRQKQDSRNG
jgi:glycosyltransferase involved in cell wall biosynthesis